MSLDNFMLVGSFCFGLFWFKGYWG
jgi:hypothetical protein